VKEKYIRLKALLLAGTISLTGLGLSGCIKDGYGVETNKEITETKPVTYRLSKLYLLKVHNTETDEDYYIIGIVKEKNSRSIVVNAIEYLVALETKDPAWKNNRNYDYISYEKYDGEIIFQEKVGEKATIIDTNYELLESIKLIDFIEDEGIDITHFEKYNDDYTILKEEDIDYLNNIINVLSKQNILTKIK